MFQIGLAHNPYGIQFPSGASISVESLLSTVHGGGSANGNGGSDRLHSSAQDSHNGGGGNGFLDKEHEREILERERNSRSSRPEIIHPLDLQPGAGGPGLVVGAANLDPVQGDHLGFNSLF